MPTARARYFSNGARALREVLQLARYRHVANSTGTSDLMVLAVAQSSYMLP